MKVTIEVDNYTANQLKGGAEFATHKKRISKKEVVRLCAQNIIDRYLDVEHFYKEDYTKILSE